MKSLIGTGGKYFAIFINDGGTQGVGASTETLKYDHAVVASCCFLSVESDLYFMPRLGIQWWGRFGDNGNLATVATDGTVILWLYNNQLSIAGNFGFLGVTGLIDGPLCLWRTISAGVGADGGGLYNLALLVGCGPVTVSNITLIIN